MLPSGLPSVDGRNPRRGPRRVDAGGHGMPSTTRTTPVSVAPGALLARNAAGNTAASLAELVRASRSVWTGAAAQRATPLDLAARGALWWSSMTDRRTPA